MATSKKREPKAASIKPEAKVEQTDSEITVILRELVDVMEPLCAGAARERLRALRARLDAL